MLRCGEDDPDQQEIPEEVIEDFCERFYIRFDERGNIISSAEGLFSAQLSDEQIDDILRKYRHDADCNVLHNSTIENSIREVLKIEEILDGKVN